MTCAELLRTQAYIDGELDDAAARDAEHHLEGCAECQAFVARAAEMGDLVRLHAERHKAPAHLRRRIIADLEAVPSRRFAGLLPGFWLGAASAGGLAGLMAALVLFVVMPFSAASFSDALIDAHAGALMSGREIQVVSSNHHTVKPWFAGRVALSPPVADFAAQGFTLAGGRTQNIDGVRMAVVVYRHGAHEIDLFVWSDGPQAQAMAVRHGYHLVAWTKGDLRFAAISDVEKAEIDDFARLVRSEPE